MITKIKLAFKRPYVFWLIGIFVFYLILNIAFSGFYNTIPLIVIYATTVNWLKLGTSVFFSLVISFLVSLVSVLGFINYKEKRLCKRESIMAGSGALTGLAVGVCPLCTIGALPLVLGLLGISFSFASLPFGGVEVQLLVIGVLAIALKLLSK